MIPVFFQSRSSRSGFLKTVYPEPCRFFSKKYDFPLAFLLKTGKITGTEFHQSERKDLRMASYLVKKAIGPADISAEWESPVWANAVTQKLEVVMAGSTSHHPCTEIRMVHDDQGIYGLFQVKDRYVRAVQKADQGQVCTDSCVEFFVRPAGEKKYFNFEMNCGGTLLLYHVLNCRAHEYDVVPQADLMNRALELAGQIAANAPLSVSAAKLCINTCFDMPAEEAIAFENRAFGLCFNTQDQKNGMKAFLEKNKCEFQGK